MAEEEKDQVQDESQEQDEKQPSLDDKLAAMKADLEKQFKSEIAGLNRKVSEKENALKEKNKQIEEMEKASLSEKEKVEYERQKAQKEAEEAKREKVQYESDLMILKGLSNAGHSEIDEIKALMMRPSTEEELDTWISNFSAMINNKADTKTNEILIGSNPKPKDGEPAPSNGKAPTTFQEAFAMEPEDFDRMLLENKIPIGR